MVGECVDIEKNSAWDVASEVPCTGVNRRSNADRRKRGIEDHGAGILETTGEPRRRDERIHGN
jgi:hypothetical protein